jgi:hypothetical protein
LTTFWTSLIGPKPSGIGIMSDILWVQKPGNEFGPKMAFLDTLGLW